MNFWNRLFPKKEPKHEHDFRLIDIHHGPFRPLEGTECCEAANMYWFRICSCGLATIDSNNLKVEEQLESLEGRTMSDIYNHMMRHIPKEDLLRQTNVYS